MSRLIATILLAILMFPLASVFYIIAYVTQERLWRWSYSSYGWRAYSYEFRAISGFACAGLLTWAFMVVYWWLLWRKRVQWTPKRRAGAVLWTLGAVMLASFTGA